MRQRRRLLKRQLRQITKQAVKVARSTEREIAGLLIRQVDVIMLVPLTNASRRKWHFKLHPHQVREVTRAARRLGGEVVGTYHSHIAGYAKPGSTDIRGAADDSLMLIIDTIEPEAVLWRIGRGRAYRLTFETI